jgi:hypothetical protein
MKQFAYRAIREALFGVAAGGFSAIVGRFSVDLSGKTWPSLESNIVVATVISTAKDPNVEILSLIITSCLFVLYGTRISLFPVKLFRTWSAGLFTGIFPVWFVLTLLLFVSNDGWSVRRLVTFGATGLIFIIASRAHVLIRQRGLTDAPIVIPEPAQKGTTVEPGVKFDLPVQEWSHDRLKRSALIREMAEQIARDQAPVLAVVGPFGEGKTSTLNLLAASLVNRADVILVRFSSWLPGDAQQPPYSQRESISSFLIRAGVSDEARAQEIDFFRHRLQRYPAERARFIGWLLHIQGLLYDGDPLVTLEKLFPLDELLALIDKSDSESPSEGDRESLQWFIQLMAKRKTSTPVIIVRSPAAGGPAGRQAFLSTGTDSFELPGADSLRRRGCGFRFSAATPVPWNFHLASRPGYTRA